MPHRILLLDDEPDLLRALSLRLTFAGFDCQTAVNGAEGLAKIQQSTPDLIITDLVMPEIDGYELVRQVRANSHTASIPIIVLTAMPKHALSPRAKELETTRIMYKPFEFDELIAMTRGLLTTTIAGGPQYG